jgi:transcriptional regulator with XRE-family HTH domain
VKEAICELIGRYVAARRLGEGLTQEEAASKAGVSRQALSEIERGTQAPRWETLYALAEVMRCEIWDLIPTVRQVKLRMERK